MVKNIIKQASKLQAIPGLSLLSPRADEVPSPEKLKGYLKAQRTAMNAAREVASLIQEGWTEQQAAQLLEQYLRDMGVKDFFHHSFAWFGERTRFDGIHDYKSFQSSQRRILPGEVFILDVAPIVNGFTCDIGYTSCLGENKEFNTAKKFLDELKIEIPTLFTGERTGEQIWNYIDKKITDTGYDNCHKIYPMSVLGHRVHEAQSGLEKFKFLHFGWQSYWNLLSRGVFGQLLSPDYNGTLTGLWAIEPHIGAKGFGAKFEEILVVTDKEVKWLEPNSN